MKPFSKINGLILLLVFGSTSLISISSILYQDWQTGLNQRPTFAQLIRSEDKSFFGFHRYFFTCLYKDSTHEHRFVSLVNSDLFHRKRVGDNIKDILRDDTSFEIVGNQAKPVAYSILYTSIVLATIGALLLIMPYILFSLISLLMPLLISILPTSLVSFLQSFLSAKLTIPKRDNESANKAQHRTGPFTLP